MPTTPHLSLNTHHFLLKIPQLPKGGMFGTCFQLLITNFFFYFLWDPLLELHVRLTVSLPASHTFTPHFILFFPFSPIILPRPLTNLAKEIKVWTCNANLHRHLMLPILCASSPSAARSPPACSCGTNLLHCDPAALIGHHKNVL